MQACLSILVDWTGALTNVSDYWSGALTNVSDYWTGAITNVSDFEPHKIHREDDYIRVITERSSRRNLLN